MILVIGRRLELPWNFADDELGACLYCHALVRYRLPGAGVRGDRAALCCPACLGPCAQPGDVWILQGLPLPHWAMS